ncbi:MAG: 2Fe-2S iron-sulfur cluster-binding protein [Steroidobacteraceae bacterium]
MRISVFNSSLEFSAAPDQTLLDAALDFRLNLPHSCKGGNCGACRARLLRGEVRYSNGAPLGLSGPEVADGMILLCQARARTDLCIETFEMRAADAATIKRLPCRIERTLPLSHDVMGVFLRLPAAEAFSFEPGQYIDIILPGGRRRSFSIASPPHDSRLLELHVRRVPGGEFTDRLFHENPARTLLNIEGPLGQFVYRPSGAARGSQPPGVAAAPMLLVGGGTGIAPLISILRHVIENGIDRDMRVYCGVRSERDLYANATLENLAARAARMRYVPVLSEPSPGWRGRSGWVHEAALEDAADIEPYEVYAAGPPAMIAAVRREFAARGVPASRLYCDSFDYAPDTLERQRTSAATKS